MAPRKNARRKDEWIISNNGEIVYPYKEAEKKGVRKREFRNAIDELMAKGFLDITHQGSGGWSGDMTKFKLDDRWKDFGTEKFRPPQNPRRRDTRTDRGWALYHSKKNEKQVTDLLPEPPISISKSVNRK